MSIEEIESIMFGHANSLFFVQSQLELYSYNQFKPIAFKGTITNREEISNSVAEIVLEMNINS